MSTFYRVSAVFLFVTVCFTYGFVRQSRSFPPEPFYQPIPTELLPGHSLPSGIAYCSFYYGTADLVVCKSTQIEATGTVYLSFDVMHKVILHDTISVDKKLGDLILNWGAPLGYDHTEHSGTYLYWPGRYVYVNGPSLSPDADVAFVSYDQSIQRWTPWRGFITLQ